MPETQTTAKSRYEALVWRRQPFLDRAREFAKLTIPSLLPPEGHNGTAQLYEPYQGLGAALVINLAQRILTALYPANQKSFRFTVAPEVLLQEGEMKANEEIERGLTLAEDAVQAQIERRGWRQPTNIALQHLIVTGNCMEQTLPDDSIKVYRLDQYVVVRSPDGVLTEFVIEEKLSPASLPEELRGKVSTDALSSAPSTGPDGSASQAKLLSLYTWGRFDRKSLKWIIHQEIESTKVEDSEGKFVINPYRALRFSGVVGEDYGRAKCEEHSGDLRAIEGLHKSLIDGAAMASRNITMIRPNAAGGLNLRRRLTKADNGDYVIGNPEDVEMLQFTNVGGLQIVSEALQPIVQRLSAAFLSSSNMRRDAERVTAYELQQVAEELEGVLGGVYSMLAVEVQAARLDRLLLQMQARGALPAWPDGVVEPTILTGLDALGRERDVERVVTAIQMMQGLPEEVVRYYPRWSTLFGKAMNGLGLSDAVNTEDEVNAQRQQEAEQAAAMAVAQAGGEAAAQGVAQAATAPPTEQ